MIKPPERTSSVTEMINAAQAGHEDALNRLFPVIYKELQAQARNQRQRWDGNLTVNTTALVHEAYLKLVSQNEQNWESRAHFLGTASKAMRHILIDYAKKASRQKRGCGGPTISIDHPDASPNDFAGLIDIEKKAEQLLDLDRALNRLGQQNERHARVVECRYFGGMTIADTAEAMGISTASVKRAWVHAQAWLYRELKTIA